MERVTAIDPLQEVRAIVAHHPLAVPHLRACGIDPNDPRPLVEAAAAALVEVGGLIAAIGDDEEEVVAPWRGRPVAALIDHLVASDHAELRDALAALVAAAAGAPHDLVAAVEALRTDLLAHLDKEEGVLLPWLRTGRGATAGRPVRSIVLDHADLLAALCWLQHAARGRRAGGLEPLRAALDRLERIVCAEVHLEHHVLFPRALGEAHDLSAEARR